MGSRVEAILNALNEGSTQLPTPKSRVEIFLKAMNGESVELPTPKSRVEELLLSIINKGNNGSGDVLTPTAPPIPYTTETIT